MYNLLYNFDKTKQAILKINGEIMIPDWKKQNISLMNKPSLNQTYLHACEKGDLELIKFILTSKDLKKHANPYIFNDGCLSIACKENYIEIVKYFLTTNDLERILNIHTDNEKPLQTACYKGNYEIAKYLLTSQELKEHANITNNNDEILIATCKGANVDLLDYLLTSSDLTNNLTINKKIIPNLIKIILDNNLFSISAYFINNNESFKEKIMERNLTQFPIIKKQLENKILNNKLNDQLNFSNEKGKKIKV